MEYKTETHRYRQVYGGYQREGRERQVGSTGAKYMVKVDGLTLVVVPECNVQVMYDRNLRLKPI